MQVEDDRNEEQIAALFELSSLLVTHESIELAGLQVGHFCASGLNQTRQFLGDCLENRRNNLKDSIDEAEQAALDVLIVILQNTIQHVEEFDLILDDTHPSEVQFEEQEEC